jgi:hypothetical protein
MNYFANASRACWKNIECSILLTLIVGGCWHLLRQTRQARQTPAKPLAQEA